jgi:hypothetical protein
MPKLQEIKGVAEKVKKSSAKQVPALVVCSELAGRIERYNAAADKARAAQAEMAELAPDLIAEGLDYVFRHNCLFDTDTKRQIKSVNLTEPEADETGTAQALQFTWSVRMGKVDEAAIKAFFSNLTGKDGKLVDVNDYAEWVLSADFDKGVFVNGTGKFDQKRFDKFKAAIQSAADDLNVENPLSFAKEFKPIKEANERRFNQLTPKQNLLLHTVMPTSASLEPIRSKETED